MTGSNIEEQIKDLKIERKAGGNVNFYATTHGVRRSYQALLLASKRFVDPMKLEGGWETFKVGSLLVTYRPAKA